MKIDPQTRKGIVRNALISVFIYLLPILLMFGSFYITGKRPWEHKAPLVQKNNTIINHLSKKP
jgi:hypothetical protein